MESFSQQVRDELTRFSLPECKNCIKAELAAILHISGSIHLTGNQKIAFSVSTEAAGVARRAFKLLKIPYNLQSEIRVEQLGKLGKLHRYSLYIPAQKGLSEMLYELGVLTRERDIEHNIRSELVRDLCCRASFLRGAFLAGGSITDPQKKTYHLEIVTQNEAFANGLVYLMSLFQLNAKVSLRKEQFPVYLKDSEAIGKFLSLINAHHGLIKMEEVKVIKGLRGEVNRLVNCETANLGKALSAAWKQVELIREMGTNRLPPGLHETAELRLQYPEASLKELGEYHLPPLSKSAVNHRLRLIREYAKKFTEQAGKSLEDEKE
ncbi:MAG TPA: DNA-binding protein WhiA [Bacillota bacterium]|nr:DNA-binding protein WhiA [Bacillota bacterium]